MAFRKMSILRLPELLRLRSQLHSLRPSREPLTSPVAVGGTRIAFFFGVPATPGGGGGVGGGVRVSRYRGNGGNGSGAGGGQKKGDQKKGDEKYETTMVFKIWNLYKKAVEPLEHFNRVGNFIVLAMAGGASLLAMVSMGKDIKDHEKVMDFLRKFSDFIREDNGMDCPTISKKDIAEIPVQLEIVAEQTRKIHKLLEEMKENGEEKKGK